MDHYVKKPVVIAAELLSSGVVGDLLSSAIADGKAAFHEDGTVSIFTLEGAMIGRAGDWLIKGIQGEFYPCKPDIFAATYAPAPINGAAKTAGLHFGAAVEALKGGARVAREGWNGKGMFLFLVNGSTFTVNREPLLSILGAGTEVQYHAHIDMKTAQGTVVPWLASQTDVLAEDWVIVE